MVIIRDLRQHTVNYLTLERLRPFSMEKIIGPKVESQQKKNKYYFSQNQTDLNKNVQFRNCHPIQ